MNCLETVIDARNLVVSGYSGSPVLVHSVRLWYPTNGTLDFHNIWHGSVAYPGVHSYQILSESNAPFPNCVRYTEFRISPSWQSCYWQTIFFHTAPVCGILSPSTHQPAALLMQILGMLCLVLKACSISCSKLICFQNNFLHKPTARTPIHLMLWTGIELVMQCLRRVEGFIPSHWAL